jgi:hypothetical protein
MLTLSLLCLARSAAAALRRELLPACLVSRRKRLRWTPLPIPAESAVSGVPNKSASAKTGVMFFMI